MVEAVAVAVHPGAGALVVRLDGPAKTQCGHTKAACRWNTPTSDLRTQKAAYPELVGAWPVPNAP